MADAPNVTPPEDPGPPATPTLQEQLDTAVAYVVQQQAAATAIAIDLSKAHIVDADGTVFQVLNNLGRADDLATRALYIEAHPEIPAALPDPLAGLQVYRAGGIRVSATLAVADYAAAQQELGTAQQSVASLAQARQQEQEAIAAVVAATNADFGATPTDLGLTPPGQTIMGANPQ